MNKIYTHQENIAWANKLEGKMTSACLIIRKNDKFLMVKANYKNFWTFPSGIVDTGESPLEAATRETKEETGLIVDKQDVRFFAVIHTVGKNGERDRFNFAFIVDSSDLKGEFNVPNDEIDQIEWVEVSNIAKMAGGRVSYQRFEELLSSHNKDFSPKFIEN